MAEYIQAVSPTPWTNNGGQIEAADGTVVAVVGTVNEQSPRDTANAWLIVAAAHRHHLQNYLERKASGEAPNA